MKFLTRTPTLIALFILPATVLMGLVFLPVGIIDQVGVGTPAVVALVSYAFFGLDAVGEEIEKLGFNKAVARLYGLVNTLSPHAASAASAEAAMKGALREAIEKLIQMIAPMMPHLAEECWAAIGGDGLVAERGWPGFDEALTIENEITLPVQINGKKRGDLTIARDADQSAVENAALALDFVQKALEGRPPRKVIVVPQRIVNVVG